MSEPLDPGPTSDLPAPRTDSARLAGVGSRHAGDDAGAVEGPGAMIGPYTLLSKLGEGGFGVVWLAERREPMVQRVALKIIKRGMDSAQVIARFEQERRALAVMDHPHVARVFDGGVTPPALGSRPYFVMEYVAGEPVTEFCDRRRLGLRERLELFVNVCEAVQHAHTKGMIHRDLKPSNILVQVVDGRPVAKVIDFGIAKAVGGSPSTDPGAEVFTQTGMIVGTPEYMSPEQAGGTGDIDTRADVYALGVVLYELLTGFQPFEARELRRAGYAEIQRIIREVEPPRPSARLSVALSRAESRGGEPDAKSRTSLIAENRRIHPGELVSVLRRELEWVPLKAMRKRREERYGSASEMAEDLRRYLAGKPLAAGPESRVYLARKFVGRHKGAVGAVAAVGLALIAGFGMALVQRDRALKRADELRRVADFQDSMLRDISPWLAGERLTADVLRRFKEATEKAPADDATPPYAGDQNAMFERFWSRVNATDAALRLIDETILKPASVKIDEDFTDQPLLAARLKQALATRYCHLGLFAQAEPLQQAAYEVRLRELGPDHLDTIASLSELGYLYDEWGRPDRAEPLWREALERRRRLLGDRHRDTLTSINNLGLLLWKRRAFDEAERLQTEALQGRRQVLGDDDPDTLISINNMSQLLWETQRTEEAETLAREAVQRGRRVLTPQRPELARYISNLAMVLEKTGRLDEAEPLAREALDLRRRYMGEEFPGTLISLNNVGQILRARGDPSGAEPLLREAAEKGRRLLGPSSAGAMTFVMNHGRSLLEAGRHADAEAVLSASEADARTAFAPTNPGRLGVYLRTLGMARASLEFDAARYARAEANLLEAYALLAKAKGESDQESLDAAGALADLYAARHAAQPGRGDDSRAAEWRSRAQKAP